ncbi:hypothetical protein H1220_06810 [Carnobacteriaceae bacterium zg-84]|uniref:MSCRAMM family protein n=1 Tax=Granulicatella sp. zg-84 TaxID=2678503 RepID=UPI0013C258B7|nr:hypothetical protein [Granulicatella sp. zg-84]QMI85425.1 hypothetical protein H1220_06810 [Carnobacteriaceae bacterium zg-84]
MKKRIKRMVLIMWSLAQLFGSMAYSVNVAHSDNTNWWGSIPTRFFDFGKFAFPIKLENLEQRSELIKKEIVRHEDGTFRIIWEYKTHLTGIKQVTQVQKLETYFTTTKDSGLGQPVITSIQKDGVDITDTVIHTTTSDLLNSTEEVTTDVNNGNYTYIIETPVLDIRDNYALDFYTNLSVLVKKGVEVTYNGQKIVLEQDKQFDLPASSRVFLSGDDKDLLTLRQDAPVSHSLLENKQLLGGEYLSETSVRWTSSYFNTESVPVTTTFNMTPDHSQEPVSMKVYYYKPSHDAHAYVLDRVEEETTTNFTVSDIPSGWIVQTEVITHITNEKEEHCIPNASLESLKTDLSIRKIWENESRPVETSYDILKNNNLFEHVILPPSEAEYVLENIDKFDVDTSGRRHRHLYKVNENVPDGYYLSYYGVENNTLHYYFANKEEIQETPNITETACNMYGVTKVHDLEIDWFTSKTWTGWGGNLRFDFKVPAHVHAGDSFSVTLPETIFFGHTPDASKVYERLDIGDKKGAIEIYHVADREFKFVVTENGVSPVDYLGYFELQGAHENKENISSVNGGKPKQDREYYFGGIQPTTTGDLRQGNANKWEGPLVFETTNTFSSTSCHSQLKNRTLVHYDDTVSANVSPQIGKGIVEEGADYIVWELVFNSAGWNRDSNLHRQNQRRFWEVLNKDIPLYHGNDASSLEKDVQVFIADSAPGGYVGSTKKALFPNREPDTPELEIEFGPAAKRDLLGKGNQDLTVTSFYDDNGHVQTIKNNYQIAFFIKKNLGTKAVVARVKTRKMPNPQYNMYLNSAYASFRSGTTEPYKIIAASKPVDKEGHIFYPNVFSYSFKKVEEIDGYTQPMINKTATFLLYDEEILPSGEKRKNTLGTYTSDKTNGLVTFDNLYPNIPYFFKEIKAPNGFERDDTEHALMVDDQGNTTVDGHTYTSEHLQEIINRRSPNSKDTTLTVVKKDSLTNQLLSGAVFELANQTGTYRVRQGEMSSASTMVFTHLSPGEYTLTEVTQPTGYILLSKPITFTVQTDGTIQQTSEHNAVYANLTNHQLNLELHIKNSKQLYHFDVIKKNTQNEHQLLQGATFRLYKEDQITQIGIDKTTDEQGHVQFHSLKPGMYYLQEVIAPVGYQLNDKKYPVLIAEDGTAHLKKSDSHVFENQSDTQGLTIIDKNDEQTYHIKLIKIDAATNALLPNARFSIKQSADKQASVYNGQIATLTTGEFEFDNQNRGFGKGTYYIHEEIAPNEYQILSEAIPITLSETGNIIVSEKYKDIVLIDKNEQENIVNIRIKNVKVGEFPKTGSFIGTEVFLLVGISLMMSCFWLYHKQRK